MPAPLTSIGGQPAEYPLPVAPNNAVVGDTIATPDAITAPAEESKDGAPVPGQNMQPIPKPRL